MGFSGQLEWGPLIAASFQHANMIVFKDKIRMLDTLI